MEHGAGANRVAALQIAAVKGHVDVVRFLLGMDVDLMGENLQG